MKKIFFVLCLGLVVGCVDPVVYPRTILKCTELYPDGSDSSGLEYWDFNKINRDFRGYTGFIYNCSDDTVVNILNIVDGEIMDRLVTPSIKNFEGNYNYYRLNGSYKAWGFKCCDTLTRRPIYELNFRGSKYHGLQKKWYNDNNGHQIFEGTFKDGKEEGLHLKWHGSNGQRQHETFYKNGLVVGTAKSWHENGQLSSESNFKDGIFDGLVRYWHENGQLDFEGNYKDGKEVGLHSGWYKNGQLWFEGNYKDGNRDGLHKSWYENGQLESEENYKDGRREGIWKFYNEEGNLTKKKTYNKGGKLINTETF